MDGTLVLRFVSLVSIPVAIVNAYSNFHYELNTADIDNNLKYINIVNQLRAKQEATDWDRQMEHELSIKYKELFYSAYDTSNINKKDLEHERMRQLLMQYVHSHHPKISKQLIQEIKGLQTTGVKVTADWRQIMAQKERVKEIEKTLQGLEERKKDEKSNLIIEETVDYMLPKQKLRI